MISAFRITYKTQLISYVLDILLPEILVRIIMHMFEVTREEVTLLAMFCVTQLNYTIIGYNYFIYYSKKDSRI